MAPRAHRTEARHHREALTLARDFERQAKAAPLPPLPVAWRQTAVNLQHPDAAMRRSCLFTLSDQAPTTLVKTLHAQAKVERDPDAARALVYRLTHFAHPLALAGLARLSTSRHVNTREWIVSSLDPGLHQFTISEVVPVLQLALDDSNVKVRSRAAQCLYQHFLSNLARDERGKLFADGYVHLPPGTPLDALIRHVNDTDGAVRKYMHYLLVVQRDPRVTLEMARATLDHETENVANLHLKTHATADAATGPKLVALYRKAQRLLKAKPGLTNRHRVNMLAVAALMAGRPEPFTHALQLARTPNGPYTQEALHALGRYVSNYPPRAPHADAHQAIAQIARHLHYEQEGWPLGSHELVQQLMDAAAKLPRGTFKTNAQLALTVKQLQAAQQRDQMK